MNALPPALRHPRYLVFWLGGVSAWMGTQMLMWAYLWHIRGLTEQPVALGVIGLIRVAPTIGLSLFAGLAADRFSRRGVLLATQALMGLVALAFGLLTTGERINLGAIYLLVGLQSLAFAYDLPSRNALVPNLVPPAALANAFSLDSLTFQIGGLAGPLLSGLLLDRYGQPGPYFAAAACFGFMLLALALIGPVRQEKLQDRQPGASFEQIREGFRFTFRQPLILSSMLLDFFATLFTRADTLMPIIAQDVLGVGEIGYGWLSAGQALGAAASGLSLSMARRIPRQGTLLLASVGLIGVGAVGFGSSRRFGLAMAALILIGASEAVSSIIRNTIRQGHTPDRLRGRMMGVNQIFFMGGPQLGELKSGLLGQWIGVPATIVLGGAGCILAAAAIGLRWPSLRRYRGEMPQQGQAA
jgi:MFS family permease